MLGVSTPNGRNTRRKTINKAISPIQPQSLISRRSVRTPKNDAKKPTTTVTPVVLQKESVEEDPKTPDHQSKPNALDPVMEKIKRDLNSPSAAARMRGQRALKSPGYRKATYEIFDVAHKEQDIITEEERQPYKPKTLREIFESCRIYVEVRTGDDNRSAGIKSKLLSDGIKVNEKLYKDTTHVIFKDGLLSTYKQSKKLNIPVTTILWIEACKAQRRLVDPTKFPISNIDRYENPELYPRMRRQKSMQPEISKQVIVKPKAVTQNPEPTTLDDSVANLTLNETENQTVRECTGMELTLKENVQSSQGTSEMNITTQFKIAIMSEERPANNRRLTTFTPRPMEQTKCINFTQKALLNSIDRRRTVFEFSKASPATPTSVDVKSVQFNSANRIAGNTRRSIMDISMNLFELNCKALEEKKDDPKNVEEVDSTSTVNTFASASEIPSVSSIETITTEMVLTQLKKQQIRKRKLFNADTLDDTLTESKENVDETLKNETPKNEPVKKRPKLNKSVEVKPAKAVKSVKELASAARRKTLSLFKVEKPPKPLPPRPIQQKYIVCTNMSSDEKQAMKAAIKKLGGHYELEVSSKTTHVVSPSCDRTMNLLRGVMRACELVNTKWLTDSDEKGKWQSTATYILRACNMVKVSERSLLGKKFKNTTFSNTGPFFIQKETIDNEKKIEYLEEIIVTCNGKLAKTRADAKIIVSDHPLTVTLLHHPFVVVSTYIFDCAMNNRVLPVAKYVPKKKKV